MWDINLTGQSYSGTWVRQFGDHERTGTTVALGQHSAHVTFEEMDIRFELNLSDIPSCNSLPIDAEVLRSEVIATLCRNMTPDIISKLFRMVDHAYETGQKDGWSDARREIREALGIIDR